MKINIPEANIQFINDNIIIDTEERRKYKNAKDNHGIQCYKELKNKINRKAKVVREKWLEDKSQEVEQLLRNNTMDQVFNTIKIFFREKRKKENKLKNKKHWWKFFTGQQQNSKKTETISRSPISGKWSDKSK